MSKQIETIDKKIEELQKKKAELIAEQKKLKTITINKVIYELEQHDNGKKLSEIIIPKGWRLLLPSEAMMLYERGLIDNSFWFYVQQTNKDEAKKGNVARFDALSDRAFLSCNWGAGYSDSSLGVIFARELEKRK